MPLGRGGGGMVGRSRSEQQEKSGGQAVSTRASAQATRRSGAGMASESCPELGQEGWHLGK